MITLIIDRKCILIKLCIYLIQVRCLSSKNKKVIDLSYADIDPVYIPINKNETVDLPDTQEEVQYYNNNSVCSLNIYLKTK